MLKNIVNYIAALVAGILLCVLTGRGLLIIPVVFLVFAELIFFVLLLLVSRNINITFKATSRCTVYKNVPVKVEMTSGSRLPFGRVRLKIRYDNQLFGYSTGQELVLRPGSRDHILYEMPFSPTDCGIVKITVEQAVCCDLFGIFSKKIKKTPEMQIVIYPQTRKFDVRQSSRTHTAETSSMHDLYKQGQDVTEVFDLRDYREGDSLKSVHWKLSGKIDHIVVREFADPCGYSTMLFYDSGFYPEVPSEADHRIMNAVLAMTASISRNMTEINMPHCVVSMQNKQLVKKQVDSRRTTEEMIEAMLSGRISDAGTDQLDYFSGMGVYNDFSKVIVVSGGVEKDIIRNIAQTASVTAIEITYSGERRVELQGNLEIIRIPLKELEGAVHAIEI